ncbi:MAG: anthranilate synthase component I family protein [Gammaproteobacteria bacterium]|nr:anthranilate synthase component I family protein [Gammaproteobacteria bacterium]
MFDRLTLARFCELAKQHKRIALHREIPGDRLTPINSYLALKADAKGASLLESSPKSKPSERYSYLYFNPAVEIKAFADQVVVNSAGKSQQLNSDPFELLRSYQKKFATHSDHPLAKVIGGMIGFVSHDAIRLIEDIPDRHSSDNSPPLMFFRFCNDSITFDHRSGKVVIATAVDTSAGELEHLYDQAMAHIDDIAATLLNGPQQLEHDETLGQRSTTDVNIETSINDENFCRMVEQARQYIINGDVFQVVVSREYSIRTAARPIDIYRALHFSNPSPYMFYLECDDFVLAGASPEQLVQIENGIVESSPLAGSRPRGKTAAEDEKLAEELANDEKEIAEHMMLVDLARNDVGSVSLPGSVKIDALRNIEKYARIMHMASVVRGQLQPGLDAFDVLKRTFPAGTLSGAPKIRAMEIIDELELSRRGIYGGAICIIDNRGNLNSCIAIRMAVIKDGVATVRAGGGIVFDSDPQTEADESRQKASAILTGIALATGEAL